MATDEPTPEDEPITFTSDELEQIEADGLTLSAAIQAIERQPE